MTRTECEAAILRKMQEIDEIYKAYNPDGDYLSMSVIKGYYNVNNSYQEQDMGMPLAAWYRPDEDEHPYSYGLHDYCRRFDMQTGEVIGYAPES